MREFIEVRFSDRRPTRLVKADAKLTVDHACIGFMSFEARKASLASATSRQFEDQLLDDASSLDDVTVTRAGTANLVTVRVDHDGTFSCWWAEDREGLISLVVDLEASGAQRATIDEFDQLIAFAEAERPGLFASNEPVVSKPKKKPRG